MLGSREKKLVYFRGVFAPRIDRFLGEGPFPRIEGLAPQFWDREASLTPSLLHPPLIAVRCQSVSQNEGLDPQL